MAICTRFALTVWDFREKNKKYFFLEENQEIP